MRASSPVATAITTLLLCTGFCASHSGYEKDTALTGLRGLSSRKKRSQRNKRLGLLGNIKPFVENQCPSVADSFSGIWGYSTGLREYALLCSTSGLHVIDVTVPEQAVQVQLIKLLEVDTLVNCDVNTHSDSNSTKTYAYVGFQSCSLWPALSIIDLSHLSSGEDAHEEDSNPIPQEGISNKDLPVGLSYGFRGPTVSANDGLLFLNTNRGDFGCQIFNLETDPLDPPLIGAYMGGGCYDSTARSAVFVAGLGVRDFLFSADGRSTKVRVADITRVRQGVSPTVLGETSKVEVRGYFPYAVHAALSEDSNYLFAFDTYTGIVVWDVSDPRNMQFVRAVQWSNDDVENSRINAGQVRGRFLFTAYHEAGFRVLDISDPSNPEEVGYYETYRDADGDGVLDRNVTGNYVGAWNVYSFLPSGNILVSDTKGGLFVFNPEDDINPRGDTMQVTGLESGGSTGNDIPSNTRNRERKHQSS